MVAGRLLSPLVEPDPRPDTAAGHDDDPVSSLLIQVLGSSRVIRRGVRGQSEMAFQRGVTWEQLREYDFQPTGRARRVERTGFTDPWLRSLFTVH